MGEAKRKEANNKSDDLDEFVAFMREDGSDEDEMTIKASAIAFDNVIGPEEVRKHMDRINVASGGTLTRDELCEAVHKGLMQNPKVCAQISAEFEKVMKKLKNEQGNG